MKRDRRRFALSPEAEALLSDADGRWERLELADGPAAQGLVPGIRREGSMPLHGPESGLPVDLRDPDTLELFE